jgi:hypothetical protein
VSGFHPQIGSLTISTVLTSPITVYSPHEELISAIGFEIRIDIRHRKYDFRHTSRPASRGTSEKAQ